MKRAIEKLLYCILKGFKWYRRKKGGKWYKYREKDVDGFAAGSEFWSREKEDPIWYIEIRCEEY